MKNIGLLPVLLLCFLAAQAQDKAGFKVLSAGFEYQQYPTGFLPGAYVNVAMQPKHVLTLKAGYNAVNHQDFGVQDWEEGGGPGGSVGYQYYFKSANKGFFIGARTDLWFNKINWTDDKGLPTENYGTTNIVVLQPTAIGGYTFVLWDKLELSPHLAYGVEINVVEKGQPVGEGTIFLWGAQLGYRF